jgi:bacterioferritin-associated ferredoxin
MNPNCSRDVCDGCPGRFVCACLQITEETVLNALASGNVRSVRDLRAATGAGEGCTCCHQQLRQYVERHALGMVGEPLGAVG